MESWPSWEELKTTLRTGDFFGHMVGIEAALSPPVPVPTSAGAGAGLLLLRTEAEGPGETLIFKPQGAVVFRLPGCEVARYENYMLLDPSAEIPPDRPIGRFPHPAIADWTRLQLRQHTESYVELFPAFFEVVTSPREAKSGEAAEDLIRLVSSFTTLVSPGLQPYLLALSPAFSALCKQVVARKRPGMETSPAAEPVKNSGKTGGMLDAITRLTQGRPKR